MTLRSRLLFTIGALILYRLGMHIPVPGVDLRILHATYSYPRTAGVAAIFTLGIFPYLEASFIVTVLSSALPFLRAMRDRGATGEATLDMYARVSAVCLAALQAYGLSLGLEHSRGDAGVLVAEPGIPFQLTTVAAVSAGTILVMWIAEQITRRGVGNGIVLILLCQSVSGLPWGAADSLDLMRRQPWFTIVFLSLVIAFSYSIVFMERASRSIRVSFPRPAPFLRYPGERIESVLQMKLNLAGIVPVVFASQFLFIPIFYAQQSGFEKAATLLSAGQPLYLAMHAGLIIAFAFLYAWFVARPKYLARCLNKFAGAIEEGNTEVLAPRYLAGVIARITLVGSFYLATICILPEFFVFRFSLSFYFSGPGLLIMTATALDTATEFRAAWARD